MPQATAQTAAQLTNARNTVHIILILLFWLRTNHESNKKCKKDNTINAHAQFWAITLKEPADTSCDSGQFKYIEECFGYKVSTISMKDRHDVYLLPTDIGGNDASQ